MTVTFMRVYSWGEIEFLGSARRISLPAAAGGTAPVELARLEAASFAAIARKAPGMAVHEVAHELEIAPALGRAGGDDLRFEEAIEPEQRRIAAQLIAHQAVGLLVSLRFERVLEHGVEEVERRIALEIAGDKAKALFGASGVLVRLVQALRGEGKASG